MITTIEISELGSVQVQVIPDGRFWWAEGISVDYGAQGDTVEDSLEHFQIGLNATVRLHLQKFGNTEKLLRW